MLAAQQCHCSLQSSHACLFCTYLKHPDIPKGTLNSAILGSKRSKTQTNKTPYRERKKSQCGDRYSLGSHPQREKTKGMLQVPTHQCICGSDESLSSKLTISFHLGNFSAIQEEEMKMSRVNQLNFNQKIHREK